MKSKRLARTASVLLLLGFSACQHYPILGQRPGASGQSPWQGFGEQSENSVQVIVNGEVEHPGTYYFPRGFTVAKACMVAGAFEAGYGHRDPIVLGVRKDGKRFSYDPRHKLPLRREEGNLELRDGDMLSVGRFTRMWP